MEDESEEEVFVTKSENPRSKRKRTEPGIIYLSRIPTRMSVKKIRQILSAYGDTGRVFLQPDEKTDTKKNRTFTEGWIEFENKKIAKSVALTLNNNQVGGKRRSPWYHELWNMKYLPKFKWGHLNERLAYEREVHKQKLRVEIAQAKKETNFYIENVEKNKVISRIEERKRKKHEKGEEVGEDKPLKSDRMWEFTQIEPETDESKKPVKRFQSNSSDRPKKKHKRSVNDSGKRGKSSTDNNKTNEQVKKPHRACDNKSFLKSIFSGGLQASDSE